MVRRGCISVFSGSCNSFDRHRLLVTRKAMNIRPPQDRDFRPGIGVLLNLAGVYTLIFAMAKAGSEYRVDGASPWTLTFFSLLLFAAGISLMNSRKPQK